jgi:hypothetical protein
MKQDPFPLHREHMDWQSEHQQWQRNLEDWRAVSLELTQRLVESLSVAFQRHERELIGHGASIDAHELAIAAEQHDAQPDEELRAAHERHAARHDATRTRHTKLATTLRQLREIVSALETVD